MPTSARQVFSAPGRAHGPCPTRRCVIEAGRTGSSAPTNRSVGRDPCVPPHTALLVNDVIAKPVTDSLVVAIRSPRPWYRGITDSHDQSADWSRNDTQILSTSVTGVAIRPPPPKMLFPSRKKRAPPPGRAPFQTDSIHQKSALPTVRGCSSTSRMLLTPVRYMTIRSKPRPKPACLQVP